MIRPALMACLLLTIARTAAAQLPAAWANWPTSAPIDTGPADAARLVSVLLPSTVLDQSGAGNGVRVIDAQGGEVPYVLHARLGGTMSEWRPVRVLNPTVVPNRYTEATLDAGEEARVHNAVRLHIDRGTDFVSWVELSISDDAKTWRVLRSRAPIYALSRDRVGESTDISYPDSTARYLRVRVLDGTQPYTVARAEVTYEVISAPELVRADVVLRTAESVERRTVWRSNADGPRVPIGHVCFETARPSFDRPVQVETTEDGERWRTAAAGKIFRTFEAEAPRSSLCVAFPEARPRQWRVTVFNYSDAPIQDLQPVLYSTPRRVVFRQEPGQRYELIYGNGRAPAPQYELARLVDAKALDAAVPATLGPERRNTAYVDPAPWSERHPAVLWSALVAAMVVLGLLAIRTLRTA